ncbi:MAG: hypothetical protein V3W31_06615 [Thermodesulfobacteriota bacterium]
MNEWDEFLVALREASWRVGEFLRKHLTRLIEPLRLACIGLVVYWLYLFTEVETYPRFDWLVLVDLEQMTATAILVFGMIATLFLVLGVVFTVKFLHNLLLGLVMRPFPYYVNNVASLVVFMLMLWPLYAGVEPVKTAAVTAHYQFRGVMLMARGLNPSQYEFDMGAHDLRDADKAMAGGIDVKIEYLEAELEALKAQRGYE